MSNTYFKFKQFTVHQHLNPMKVCTDSCLFGAWIPVSGNGRLLDIGTGTGLLSLMLAQRFNGLVDAVELQPEAALEARVNVGESPWCDRITVHRGNALDASLPVYKNRYDVVVCNPPFYQNHLTPENAGDATARHNTTLPLHDLLNALEKLLSTDGSAFLLLPYEPFKNVTSILVNSNLKLAQAVAVKNTADKPPIRWMIELKQNAARTASDEIIIYNADKTYTEQFTELLKPYYLNL